MGIRGHAFIEIRKLRKEDKLRIKAEEIIKNLIYELKTMVIKNIMKKDNKDSFKARTRLDKFHDLVIQFAETFQEARELGLSAAKEPKGPKKPGKGRSDENGPGAGRNKGSDKNKGDKDNGDPRVPKGDGKCIYCGGKHFVKDCPT